ncbi:hypothetical protein MKQ68_22030 [Chitinophaga horti]|uniref:TonB-dependent receptor plug domain-containing protein n=1 Tax=Chitinophaga horti TaxID=2920382 RepID=A0ABY6J3J1_9BACT|nr:hypothetical protein [Chitinophaga horti]UYQ92762.1 hypothetical protein MKQ68_22030 [Chitinophaga horti]
MKLFSTLFVLFGITVSASAQSQDSLQRTPIHRHSAPPLYIVNGVYCPGNLDGIKPESIVSIDVLKNHAAALKYGDISSNGVLLIVTNTQTSEGVSLDKAVDEFFGSRLTNITEYAIDGLLANVHNIKIHTADVKKIEFLRKGDQLRANLITFTDVASARPPVMPPVNKNAKPGEIMIRGMATVPAVNQID